MEAIESNLFENVPEEQFDQMYANGPFFEGNINDPMDYACYGARSFIENLFSGVKDYLSTNGKLLIVMSAWADLDHFKKIATKNGLRIRLIATRKSDDEERMYHLYEVTIT